MATNAGAVVSEVTRLVQSLQGLPVNLGEILEELAVNVLAPRRAFSV